MLLTCHSFVKYEFNPLIMLRARVAPAALSIDLARPVYPRLAGQYGASLGQKKVRSQTALYQCLLEL